MLAQRVFFYMEDLLLGSARTVWRRAFSRLFEVSSFRSLLSDGLIHPDKTARLIRWIALVRSAFG